MQEITKWRTEDGKVFDTPEEAQAHETLVGRVKEITAALGERNRSILNGQGYVQHDPKIVRKVRKSFYQLALEQQGFDKAEADEHIPNEYLIGRYLNDSNSYLYDVWCRLQCIDTLGREFDQPYYALHPEKAKLVEIK